MKPVLLRHVLQELTQMREGTCPHLGMLGVQVLEHKRDERVVSIWFADYLCHLEHGVREGLHDALVVALGEAHEEGVDQVPVLSSEAESYCGKVVGAVEESFFGPGLLACGDVFKDERAVFLDVLDAVDESAYEFEGLSLDFVFGILQKSHVESLELASLEHLGVFNSDIWNLGNAGHSHFFIFIHTELLEQREYLVLENFLFDLGQDFGQVAGHVLSD